MAQAFVQKTTATGGAGTAITTPAFAGSTVVGNQLVATSSVWNSASGNSITNTDSKTNTWTRDKTFEAAQNGGFGVATISQTILAAAKAGSAHTVTTTASKASSDLQADAAEFSGSTANIDQSTTQSAAGSTTTITATTAATTNANGLVIGCLAYASPSTNNHVLTPANVNGSQTGVNSLQVVQDGNTLTGVESSYKIISATGTQAVNWTYDSQALGGYAAVVVVYMAASVVGGAKPPQDTITLNPGGVPFGPVLLAPGLVPNLAPIRWQNWESYPWAATAVASIDIASAGALTITGAASLASSVGTLAAAGALNITGAALLNATGTIAGAGTLLITGAAALTSTGTLASAGTLAIVGGATLTAQGTLAAAGTLVINGSASMPGLNDMVSAGNLTISAAAALTAIGSLASAGTVTITGAAPLTSIGTLASAGTVVITGASNITAPSANDMAAAGTIFITSSAALSALGSLAASGALTITGAALLDDGAVVVTTTPGRREKHPDPPTQRLLRNWRLPSQVRGETEDEKRLRRIAQGILPPDPHPTLVEEATAAAIKSRAEDAQRRAQASRLTREVAELRAATAKYRGRAKASDKAKAARTRIELLDRQIATLHAQEAQRQDAITAEESDIAFLISVLDSID